MQEKQKNELVQGINGSGKKLQSRIWFFSLVESENDIPTIKENFKKSSAVNVFCIRHDKDKIRQDDGSLIDKKPHWHFAVRYENPTPISTIANICLVDVNHYNLIQKAKNFKACCRYEMHLDDKDKHPYKTEEVEVLKGSKDEFFNIAIGKAQYTTTDADLFPDFGDFEKVPYRQQYLDVFNNVDDTKRRNLLLKELKVCYDNYMDKRRFEMENKNVKVIFIEGAPGTGKSTFAKSLAVSNHKSYCISSSSNDVLQDYEVQDYLILDDLRDDAFSFADLLKLLDNFVLSSVKSRYKNKLFLGECIIITSTKPLVDWYKNSEEDKRQLYRRINMFVVCRRLGSSCLADLYIPPKGEPAIGSDGIANYQTIFTQPIIDISPSMVQSVEDAWASLGIDVKSAIAKGVVTSANELTGSKMTDKDIDNVVNQAIKTDNLVELKNDEELPF